MTKDYAKKPSLRRSFKTRRRFRSFPENHSRVMPTWMGMVIGLLLGMLLSAMIYWKLHPVAPSPLRIKAHTHTDAPSRMTPAHEKTHAQFDFYTMLPKMKIEPTENTAVQSTPVTQELQEGQVFWLQVASFKQSSQAEQLKVKLLLEGFNASVQTVVGKETWYRVQIGPFYNKSKALACQQQLERTNALHSLLVKIRV